MSTPSETSRVLSPSRKGQKGRAPSERKPKKPLSESELALDVFTTGLVGRLCGVAARTVTKWFDTGRLRGYRIPGSNDRRFPRPDVVRFLKESGLPQLALLEPASLVAVGLSGFFWDHVRAALPADLPVVLAPDLFAAGCVLAGPACCVLVDAGGIGRSAALSLASHLAAREQRPRLMVLATEDDPHHEEFLAAGYDRVLGQPVAAEDVALALVAVITGRPA